MTVPLGPLGLGTAQLGNLRRAVSDEQADAALHSAWDGGIRHFDTAPHYGLGLAERRLGAFLRQRPRDAFVLSSKVGRLLVPNPAFSGGRDLAHGFDVPDDLVRAFDPTTSGLRRSLEESLERLGLDRIDLLYLHDPDAYDVDRGLREGLPALAQMRDEGLVEKIGIGVNDADVAARAVREGALDIVMIAGRYTLLEQSAADDLLPMCVERGVRVVAAAVFNSGLLASKDPGREARYDYAVAPATLIARANDLAEVCQSFGVDLPTAALHFPLRHPVVDAVVAGSADARAIAQNIARMSATVPGELWPALVDAGLIATDPAESQ